MSPKIAVTSGNNNGANGIALNTVAGKQEEKLTLEKYLNLEKSQTSGGGGGGDGGLLGGLLWSYINNMDMDHIELKIYVCTYLLFDNIIVNKYKNKRFLT